MKHRKSDPSRDAFYDSPKWNRLRLSALRRDNYMDMECKRYGKVKAAEVVHHIFPKNEFPEYAYCLWNLISLSRQTHNEMHDRDTDELTEKGRDLLRRTCRKQNVSIPDKYDESKRKPQGRVRRDTYYDYKS